MARKQKTAPSAEEERGSLAAEAKAKAPGTLRLVLGWAGSNRRYLVASVVCAIVSGLMTLVPYGGVFEFMRAAYEDTLSAELTGRCALVVAAGCVLQYAGFTASSLLAHKGAYATLFDVRCRTIDHLSRVPLGELDERATGQIETVLLDDVEQLETFLAHSIPEAFMYLSGPLAAFVFLCSVNVPLALGTLIPFVCALLIMGYCFSVMGKLTDRMTKTLARMNSVMVEYVSGMRVVKALNMGSRSFRRFRETIDDEHAIWCEVSRKTGPAYALYLVIIECGLLVTVPLGGVMFVSGAIPGSTYLLFAFVGSLYLTEIRLLQELGTKLAQVSGSARRVDELLEIPSFEGGVPFPAHANVELDDVVFSYDEKTEVLHHVSLDVAEGERLAVVGPSGAGKTTMVELIGRFYDVGSGAVRIGGVDVRDIDYEELLQNVAVVFQKAFLTSGTILENIRMGSDANLDEVRAAARRACMTTLLRACPRDTTRSSGAWASVCREGSARG